MLSITEDQTIIEILSNSAFNGIARYIMKAPENEAAREIFDKTKLNDIKTGGMIWDTNSLLRGLNRIIELKDDGHPVNLDIWSKEEREENPLKSDTSLFCFPAKHPAGIPDAMRQSTRKHPAGIPNTMRQPFALICPGGGYRSIASLTEGYPIAARLNERGYTAFVLHYRVGKPGVFKAAREDLAKALHFILENAETLGVKKEGYSLFGFSAGGHLAASLSTDNHGFSTLNLPPPSAIVLGYPVITLMSSDTQNMHHSLVGTEYTRKDLEAVSIQCHVNNQYPPTFLWQCKDDDLVPVFHSELMAESLAKAGVKYEYRPYPQGGHGCGEGIGTAAEGWMNYAVKFWEDTLR